MPDDTALTIRPAPVPHWLRRDAVALLVFVLASLLAIHPILLNFGSQVLGWPGDNIVYVYMTGWVARAPLLGQSPFIDPHLNYPDVLYLATTDVPFLFMLAVSPVTLLFGPTFGYNFIIVLSHFLSGYVVYRWIMKLTGSRYGGIVAGLAFMLSAYRIYHSYGHLQFVATQALPLFFWALDDALSAQKPTVHHVRLLAGATFLVGSMSQYNLLICLLTGLVYALLTLRGRAGFALRYGWLFVAAIGAGAVVSAAPYISVMRASAYHAYSIETSRFWSASPADYLIPSELNPFWAPLVERETHDPRGYPVEFTLYLGAVATLLAAVGLRARSGSSGGLAQRKVVWLGVGLAAVLFSLGTDLHLNGSPLQDDPTIWLPMGYLGQLPFFSFMRTWARFGVITVLFISLLAGLGAAYLENRRVRWRVPALALVALLLLADLFPGRLKTTTLEPTGVDRWLARQPGDFAVAYLPANDLVANYRAMYGALTHGKKVPAYIHPVHQPAAYADFAEEVNTFPDQRAINALDRLGIKYIVVDRAAFNGKELPTWEAVAASVNDNLTTKLVTELDGFAVIALEEPPAQEARGTTGKSSR